MLINTVKTKPTGQPGTALTCMTCIVQQLRVSEAVLYFLHSVQLGYMTDVLSAADLWHLLRAMHNKSQPCSSGGGLWANEHRGGVLDHQELMG